ncbi:MAG: M23 family metallopeptidase [Candidatus Binatia bacterium]
MRAALAVLGAAFLLIAGLVWWVKFEHRPPRASLVGPVAVLGHDTPVSVVVRCDAPGLSTVTIRLRAGDTLYELLRETYPAPPWWGGSGVTERTVHLQADLLPLHVPEGPATLEVLVDSYAWHLFPPPAAPRLAVPLRVDLTPPRIELLTTQHAVRLGGVAVAIFRQSPDTVRSGIKVAQYFFPSTTGYFADQNVALAFFAIPQDLTVDAKPRLLARDAAGNQREVDLPCHIRPRRFRHRTLAVSDAFLARKVPEIEQENGLPVSADLVKGYLYINGELRRENEATIRRLTARSQPAALWNGAFVRQPNAAAVSAFADRRTYTYHGKVIDHQTHLGYDLASLKMSPVAAAQNGIVVFAGDLGIYGNAVILDHGLGIFSLYGHLSSIAVQQGQRVQAAQTLGQTGETGLAGGDHLHFSVMLFGVHVDPLEWWDAHWLREHVTRRLMRVPRAKPLS